MIRLLITFLLALLLAGLVQASPTPAGVVVTNTATGSYVDSTTGLNVRLTSNTVSTVVQAFEALLLSSNQSITLAPGIQFTLPHQITNTGNVTSTYVLNLVNAGGSFALSGLMIIEDLNSNGVADPGEPVLGSSGSIALLAGARLNLLVSGTVPVAASVGQTSQIKISATSQLQGVVASNTDSINIANGPSVAVTKSASTSAPVPNGLVTYTLTAINNGNGAADPIPVIVDGAITSVFLLRDAIPSNTTFISASKSNPSAQILYHRLGDAADNYQSVQPSVANVDGIAWAISSLAAKGILVGSFTVMINGNASGAILNTGYADFSTGGAKFTSASNPVQLSLPVQPPTINFYPNNAYTTPTRQSSLGVPLFVQVNAAQCNTDPTKIITHPITLTSQLTGDTETFTATETAANSGIFRILPNVPTANAIIQVVAAGDGILELLRNDRITASLAGCGSITATTTLLIDPSGIVFDSKTNATILGATVTLIDVTGGGNGGNVGGAARVFQADGFTPAPSTVVTGADGSFNFPFVPASTYRFLVTPPNGYAFASKLPIGLLPVGRSIDNSGSYGGNFSITASGGPVTIDIPLDSSAATGLFIQKTASKTIAEVGDFVNYSININNTTGINLQASIVNDSLPAGFGYVKGSARLNGLALTDPVGGAGPALAFGIGQILANTQSALTYRVRIGPGGESGSGINTAQMTSGLTRSNQASVKVKITGGIFSDKAYVFGKVYADCNINRIQDAGELGIPNVRIYLDNGTYAITDSEGKYSLYGLTPRTYVAKIDNTSLPTGASLEILSNRNAEDAASQFVDLKNSELHKADFAISGCTTNIREQIATRRQLMQGQAAEISKLVATPINLHPTVVSDVRTLPSSGIAGQQTTLSATSGNLPKIAPSAPLTVTAIHDAGSAAHDVEASHPNSEFSANAVASQEPAAANKIALEKLLPTLTSQVGFIDLKNNEIMPTDQTRVRVKGPYGAKLHLNVNGQVISLKQVGEQSSLESHDVTAWDYIGINLKSGDNILTVVATDPFANDRGSVSVHVIAPGVLAKIKLDAPAKSSADGRTLVNVIVHMLDASDIPVTTRTLITLESNQGEWQTADVDPKEPGTQVFVEGGVGHFNLLAPAEPSKAKLHISSGGIHTETEITFLPNLRPLIAAGIVEGVINLRNLNPNALVPTQSGDIFEREIQSASQSFGKGSAAARTSLFLKGKIKGRNLLTIAYDSDKPSDTALFRDIQPDQFYPVYGDSSVKGYDAQSTGRLYVRLDHGTSYGLYGDYSTQSNNPARLLSQYTRALNGAKTHIENGSLTVDGFVSNATSTQIVDEIIANGTSGPYHLTKTNSVINSQRVSIVTRDRNQPSIVISEVPLVQFTDYAIEPYTDNILFKAPVPSLDASLNPIYIRVSYEVSDNGASFWIEGIDLRKKITDSFTLGGTYIDDANPANKQKLTGANFLWNIGPDTTLVTELAQSNSDTFGTGDARRVELRHTDPKLQAKMYAVQTDPSFNNPSSTYTSGASEYGAKIGYIIDNKNRLIVEAIKSTTSGSVIQTPSSIPLVGAPLSIVGGGSREGESIGLEHSLPLNLKLTTSLRHVDSNDQPTQALAIGALPNTYTSARIRLDSPIPGLPAANAFVQYEQALDDASRKATTIGGTYQVAAQTKLYATHETSNSLTGDYGLNASQQNYATVIGIDTTYMQDGQLFNEYRVGDGIDGRSARAALGLRNLWHLAPGLGLSTSIQQVHPISGVVRDKATALAAGLEYTANPDWKGSTRLEWSKSDSAETWLSTVGVAAKINQDVTVLTRGIYNQQLSTNLTGGSIRLSQAQFGVAYRPVVSDVWNALARVEFKRSLNTILGLGQNIDEAANILSTHVNYQPNASWLVNGRYGIKRVQDYSSGFTSSYTAQILGARSTWDINSKWDAGLQYYIELGGTGASVQQAIGAELGYLVMKNLWLSTGYNIKGFTDRDLSGEDYTQRGFYLRMRFKFDEHLFKPNANTQPLAANGTMQ